MSRRYFSYIAAGIIVCVGIGIYTFKMTSKVEPVITMEQTDKKTAYTITQKEGEYIVIESKNLLTNSRLNVMSTKDNLVPLDISYVVIFEVTGQDKEPQAEIILSISDLTYGNSELYKIKQNPKKAYSAFVPYAEIQNGILGVFIFSDNQKIVESVKKDPHKAKDQISSDDILEEYTLKMLN